MQILKAHRSHTPAVLSLVSACKSSLQDSGIHQWDDLYPNADVVFHDQAAGTLFVAAIADNIVGTVSLSPDQEPEYSKIQWRFPESALVIHRLCISPAHQGRGIGSSLMRFAENHARCNGFLSIRLDVYSGNQGAVSLYERLGYIHVGQITFPRRTLPFYCMEKPINPVCHNDQPM